VAAESNSTGVFSVRANYEDVKDSERVERRKKRNISWRRSKGS